ncbi:MAG: hypothetical protein QG599_1552 [Pseudomonadota bacterium]|nr:hypothetical protein [Pseudomonadota bacterium]
MTLINEQIIERNGIQIKVLEFADGSHMELLANISAEQQERILQMRQHHSEALPDPQSLDKDWGDKTAFPLGMREDGTFFQASEVKAFLQRVMTDGELSEKSP